MADPKRLLEDGEAPEALRELIGSISLPQAPSSAKQAELAHQLAALGTSSGAVATSVGTSLWLKAAILGSVALAAGVWWAVGRSSDSSVAGPTSVAAKAPESPATTEPEVALPSPLAAEVTPEPKPTLSPAPSTKKLSARDALAEEEALLEQARRAAPGSPGAAFALLQQHQRRFPNGQLTAERMFLGVEVLTRLGDKAAARKQTEALIRRFPNSVYAAQLKARKPAPEFFRRIGRGRDNEQRT